MQRFLLAAAVIIALMSVTAGRAEARLFEPQHDWWSSGRTCIDSRNPPGLAWDDLAPRACVAQPARALEKPRADAFAGQADYALVGGEETLADKFAAKIAVKI
jgi:hypothetical protein